MTQTSASNRKDIRKAEKELAADEVLRGAFITQAMESKNGRMWIHSLLESCHIFNDPFSGEALVEAYNKGERNVGLRLLADVMKYALNQYITMMDEHNVRRTLAEQSRRQNANGGPETTDTDYPEGPESEPGDEAGSETRVH